MPRVSGVIAGSRYAAYSSHALTSNRQPAALARGLTLDLSVKNLVVQRGESFRASAQVKNTGAGHAIPTGDPSHALEVRFDVEGPSGARPRGVQTQSTWLRRELEPEAPFSVRLDERVPASGQRVADFSFVPPKKTKPGRYELVVSVVWWAADPARLEALGLEPEGLDVVVTEQRVSFELR